MTQRGSILAVLLTVRQPQEHGARYTPVSLIPDCYLQRHKAEAIPPTPLHGDYQ